jgi:NDP-sugar pyrophosphorylase family protein
MGVYEVPDPARCGIVGVDQHGIVRSFVEKPREPASNLAFSGLLVATPQVLDLIPPKIPADIGFDVLPQLVGRMAAFHIIDYLIDIGTMETYASAQRGWPGLS